MAGPAAHLRRGRRPCRPHRRSAGGGGRRSGNTPGDAVDQRPRGDGGLPGGLAGRRGDRAPERPAHADDLRYQLEDAEVSHGLVHPLLEPLAEASGLPPTAVWVVGDELDRAVAAAEPLPGHAPRPDAALDPPLHVRDDRQAQGLPPLPAGLAGFQRQPGPRPVAHVRRPSARRVPVLPRGRARYRARPP